MITIVAFFWYDKERLKQRTTRAWQDKRGEVHQLVITPDDVRVWKSMVERNLTVPHKIICVTHRPDWVEDFIDWTPLDMTKDVPGSCLVKLQAHKVGGVAEEGDRVLLMDVDCVVTGNLDAIVDRPEPHVFWKNPNFEMGGKRGFIQGSMQLFTVGTTEFLWSDFDPKSSMRHLNRRFGGAEQCWISERMNADYPNEGWLWATPHWTEADGVYGAGRLFNGRMGAGVQTELPANARIVFTPGDRSPSQPEFQALHPWVKEHYW